MDKKEMGRYVRAHWAGSQAWEYGQELKDNPYPLDTIESKAWADGYSIAEYGSDAPCLQEEE